MQSAASHAHHPVPTYIASALWLAAAIAFGGAVIFGWSTQAIAFACLLLAVFVNISIERVYTTGLQDRIIMLEMKVRCAEFLPAGQDANLAKLSKKQMAALRFASDDELGSLLERAARENLSPKDIKASIRTWRPDPHRT